jgi:phosphatidylserine decarboxylase
VRIPFARYGLGTLLTCTLVLAAVAALGAWLLWPLAVLAGLLWLQTLWFFRDPERTAQCAPEDLLSPADGTVRDIEEVDPPGFLEGRAVRVGIFMSVFNVHVNRSPADAMVRWVSYCPGTFHDARAGSVGENEHNLMGLELADGRRILVNQVAGAIARRIVCEPDVGTQLARGQRFGMIKFGSRLEVYLPLADGYRIAVRPGDRVQAGLTVLASRPVPGARRADPQPPGTA